MKGNAQNSSHPNPLLHFTIIYALEVIYGSCTHMVEIFCNGVLLPFPSPVQGHHIGSLKPTVAGVSRE